MDYEDDELADPVKICREVMAEKYEFLKVGDIYQAGDRYGLGFCFHIGNPAQTSAKPGDKVTDGVMGYLPRRPKAKNR